MLKKILLLGFCLTVFWPALGLAQKSAPVTGETRAEIVAVIGSQLAAFGRDDGIEAFSYAAPGIRAQFGSVGNFMAMVKTGYGIVYRQQAHEFLETREWNGITAQAVRLIDFDGASVIALYTMEQLADGSWRITGVRLVESGETAS